MSESGIITLLDAVATATAGDPVHIRMTPAQAHVYLSANSDASATVVIEGSNEESPEHWFPIVTFVLSGSSESAGRSFGCRYFWFRARVAVITGSGTTVGAVMNASLT